MGLIFMIDWGHTGTMLTELGETCYGQFSKNSTYFNFKNSKGKKMYSDRLHGYYILCSVPND